MDIQLLKSELKNCPCGRAHSLKLKVLEIGSGLVNKVGDILKSNNFPTKILLVADQNTLKASEGIIKSLLGYDITYKIYDNLKEARIEEVIEISNLLKDNDGVLAVGTGSLNDICRLAAYNTNKEFAIFATAPSMDGFASDSAPIITGVFKETHRAKQPSIIIADTKILAESPIELKAAGYGDMIAKYIALVDWKLSHLITGEYYCEKVATITRDALRRIVMLTDKVKSTDEEAAGSIMEALVLTGIAMGFVESPRPASGAEHIVSHYWEIKKLMRGERSDFHGKKVGVATLLVAREYHRLGNIKKITIQEDKPNWDDIYKAYGKELQNDIIRLNTPTVTSETTPQIILENWDKIREIIAEMPSYEELLSLMLRAGAATICSEIAVDKDLEDEGMKYSPYMRHRMTLLRIRDMIEVG